VKNWRIFPILERRESQTILKGSTLPNRKAIITQGNKTIAVLGNKIVRLIAQQRHQRLHAKIVRGWEKTIGRIKTKK